VIHKAQQLSVSVIVPVRNEKGKIARVARDIPEMGKHTEIIFVEGNSTDGTKEEIEKTIQTYNHKDIKLLVQKGRGKRDAVMTGFDYASGDILMICDGDLTTPPEDLPKFYDVIVSGKGEFVNASRFVYQMEGYAMPFTNKVVNKFFSVVFKWLLGQRLTDTLCGTKVLLKRDYFEMKKHNYFPSDDYFGDFSLIFGATRANLKIIEIPIAYKVRTYGVTKISSFRSGWLLFTMMFKGMKSLKFFSI
jgi:glycosyltransferase involved in cell wall biosynthesis